MDLSEQSEVVQEVYALEDNLLSKSTGELISTRAMQLLGEDEQQEEEDGNYSEYIEQALKNTAEDEVKKLSAGALVTLVRQDKIPVIPASTPVRVVTQLACLGVDNAKTMFKIAKKEISMTEGLQIITRNTVATVFGILSDSSGKLDISKVVQRIPIIGKPLKAVVKVSNSLLNLVATPEVKEKIKVVQQRIVPIAREFTQNFVNRAVSTVKSVVTRVKNFLFG